MHLLKLTLSLFKQIGQDLDSFLPKKKDTMSFGEDLGGALCCRRA